MVFTRKTQQKFDKSLELINHSHYMKNLLQTITFLSIFSTLLFSSVSTFAHVVVKPDTAKPASYQTFTVNVPNEKDIPTIKLKLVFPEGLQYVGITNKIGWSANISKDGDKIKEVEWSGGSISKDFRDEFSFAAKTPAKEEEIIWKAYQTYQDGTVVSWDQNPSTETKDSGKEESTPYSKTAITAAESASTPGSNLQNILLWVVSLVALFLAASAFMRKPEMK
jgi:uncharacterized protein YcnI